MKKRCTCKWHLGVGGSLGIGSGLGVGSGLNQTPARRLIGRGLGPAPVLLNGDELVARELPRALSELDHNVALLSCRKAHHCAHLARRDVAV